MRYKVGDRVLIKTLAQIKADGYYCGQGPSGLFIALPGGYDFISAMEQYCGKVVTITSLVSDIGYTIGEDVPYIFTDPMIKGRVCNID